VDNSSYLYPLALTMLEGIGSIRAKNLIAYLGSAEAVFKAKKSELAKVPGVPVARFQRKKMHDALLKAEEQLDHILAAKHRVFYYLNSDYPRRLKQAEDAPLLLYGKGNFDPNPRRVVGIVGTRNMTDYGRQLCTELIHHLKGRDITVVSGLAHGVDGLAHQLCVREQIPTIGVLGHGLDKMYPAIHRSLAKQMEQCGGLLSEYPPGTIADSAHFPMRNRIVAGMVDALIVIESDVKGGSLITCDLANDYNKEVFAFPGSITARYSRGCNKLIADNKAHLLLDGEHLLTHMDWLDKAIEPAAHNLFDSLDEEKRKVCETLQEKEELSIDELSVRTALPQGKLSGVLLELEISGFVRMLPGKRYRLSRAA
jgi:DNA processing protein